MSNQQFKDFEKNFLSGIINTYMYAKISIAGTEKSETKKGRVIDVSLTDPTVSNRWATSFKFTTDNPEIK